MPRTIQTYYRAWLVSLATFLLCLLAAPESSAKTRTETDIKSAYLLNFTRFITWPPASLDDHFDICVVGDPQLLENLKSLESRTHKGIPFRVRPVLIEPDSASVTASPREPTPTNRLRRLPDFAQSCDVLFVSTKGDRKDALNPVDFQGSPVLTVSDADEFAESGGIIGLHKQGNVIRFRINLSSAQKAGLAINSRLLQLATEVLQ